MLNRLKNRVDSAAWYAVPLNTLLTLPWPRAIGKQPRAQWSRADAAEVARYEGIPVQVEGYLVGAKQQGPETANCHAADDVDNHLWVTDDPNKDRTRSIVAEVTPRMRARHPGWAFGRIAPLVDRQTRVRISGWLMMDQEHPDQIGKTRGTTWEIHPIIAFEVLRGNTWVSLDTGRAVPPQRADLAIKPTTDALPPPIVDPDTPREPAAGGRPVQRPRPGNPEGDRNSSGPVAIVDLRYRGDIKPTEPDEYVELANTSSTPVDMNGWALHDIYGGQTFRWNNFTLRPNARIRVYTNQQRPASGGFSFNSGQAIWNNGGDAAELLDANGAVVATYAYGDKR